MLSKWYQTFLNILFEFCILFLAFKLSSLLTGGTSIIFKAYSIIADALIFIFFFIVLSGLIVRILFLINPFCDGEKIRLDSRRSWYWKLVLFITEFGGIYFLPFTVVFLRPLLFRLFGLKTGKNVVLSGKLVEPYLISIGDYSIVGKDSLLIPHNLTSGEVSLGKIKIGRNCVVGVNAVIMPGVEIGDRSCVAAGSVVLMNTKIPPDELWGGIPAKKIKSYVE